jgi:nucleoside-diphosphate-sugar epimerase
MLTVSVS